jgi:hypothetical protein
MTKTGICQGPDRPHGTAIAIRPAAPAGLAARTRTGPKTIRRSAMTDYAHAVSDADAMRYQVMAQPAARSVEPAHIRTGSAPGTIVPGAGT